MVPHHNTSRLDEARIRFPEKFISERDIFSHIHRGDRIFIGTGCGEPQYLVRSLIKYVESNPKAFFDAEILHVWTLGIAPHSDERFKHNFRPNSFFVAGSTREAVNRGMGDYTPVFLSRVPDLFRRGLVPIDVALVQVSPPDEHGYMSLGVSVDISKEGADRSATVIAQVNSHMPRVHGDGFIHMKDVDFIIGHDIGHDEPLPEYQPEADTSVSQQIGTYVARLVSCQFGRTCPTSDSRSSSS